MMPGMNDEQRKEDEAEVIETEEVEDLEADVSDDPDDDEDYQEPITTEEVKEVIEESWDYTKDAIFQPAREIARSGMDAIVDFARGMSGKKRRRRKRD